MTGPAAGAISVADVVWRKWCGGAAPAGGGGRRSGPHQEDFSSFFIKAISSAWVFSMRLAKAIASEFCP